MGQELDAGEILLGCLSAQGAKAGAATMTQKTKKGTLSDHDLFG
jgi:imidazole glycerol phosphate synthase subunit HisF